MGDLTGQISSVFSYYYYTCWNHSLMNCVVSIPNESSRRFLEGCLHVTHATNGIHHMSRTFFWRTHVTRNIKNPWRWRNVTDERRIWRIHILDRQFKQRLDQAPMRINICALLLSEILELVNEKSSAFSRAFNFMKHI